MYTVESAIRSLLVRTLNEKDLLNSSFNQSKILLLNEERK